MYHPEKLLRWGAAGPRFLLQVRHIMVGSTIGKYRIVEQLGRGGMGTVYKAIDETLDREVAIKALNADLLSEDSMQRFRGEAVLLAKLNHPRIAAIHELTRQDKDLLMVMEYVRGETCEKLVARTGPMPVARAVVLCDQILDALEHAHAAGIVHRDLKPGNVMVTPAGDVKVMDFGIARVAGSEHLTLDGYMMGTPAYMAPEQVRGEEVDRRMDLYSAAVMLYRLVTSRLPFEADSAVTLIHQQLSDPPTPPKQFRPDLPEWIDAILARGLAKAPADRFQTAAEFRLALERGLAGTLTQLRRTALDDNAETLGPTPTPTALRKLANVAAIPQTEPLPSSPTSSTGGTRVEPTVVLRKPQLVMAGGLLALLVVGVGILAYAALRRPSAPVAAPSAVTEPSPTPQQPPPVTGAASSEPTSSGSSATAATPAASDAPATSLAATPAPAATPTSTPAPAARGSVPASATPPSASAATPSTKSGTASKPTGAPTAARSGGAAAVPPAVGSTAAAPRPEPAAVHVATPTLPAQSFGDVKTLIPDSTNATKSKELDALLNLDPDRLIVRNKDNGAVVQTTTYKSITAATYTRAKGPRWQDGAGLAPIPKSFSGSGFLKSSKHWLTLQSPTEFVILRLEDKNVRPVIASIESRTGVKVQRAADKD